MTPRRLLPACLLLLTTALLAACGKDEPPTSTPAPIPEPAGETWHYDPQAMLQLVADRDPGGMGWIPAETLAELEKDDLRGIGPVAVMMRDTVVARMTLYEDHTFELRLRAEQDERAWRTVDAKGTWRETGEDTLLLTVNARESRQLAPLEIADELPVRRVGTHLHLTALDRTIPLMQVQLPR